jgi:hypothetical protein
LSFSRLFTNRVVWLAVGVLAVLQMVFVYAPFMQRLFGSTALELRHWPVPLGIGLAVFLLVEAEKTIFRRFGTAEKPSPMDEADTERDHSKRAYALWEEAGRPDGRELEFWSQAEAELAAESKAPKPPGKTPPPDEKQTDTPDDAAANNNRPAQNPEPENEQKPLEEPASRSAVAQD